MYKKALIIAATLSLVTNSLVAFTNPDLYASFYGTGDARPSTKEELCSYLDGKLNSTKKLTEIAKHRYEKDYELHCQEKEELHSSAEEDQSNLRNNGFRFFLREATEGAASIARTSYYWAPFFAEIAAKEAAQTTDNQ
ncbi:hypothetical protein IT412_03920 [Candidatus Peregrinibacteria bacterium]|nr:hypothetical protein [Candidatus Peregrinibacteria bacterium]